MVDDEETQTARARTILVYCMAVLLGGLVFPTAAIVLYFAGAIFLGVLFRAVTHAIRSRGA